MLAFCHVAMLPACYQLMFTMLLANCGVEHTATRIGQLKPDSKHQLRLCTTEQVMLFVRYRIKKTTEIANHTKRDSLITQRSGGEV